MGLISETNEQYYAGAQIISPDGTNPVDSVVFTFDTPLKLGAVLDAWKPTNIYYPLNNFKIYNSASGLPGSFSEISGITSLFGPTIKRIMSDLSQTSPEDMHLLCFCLLALVLFLSFIILSIKLFLLLQLFLP